MLFQNNERCLFNENREDFLKNAENLNKRIIEIKNNIKKMEKLEIHRIIKEFDFKNYGKRFSIDVTTLLASLVGIKKALKEISKYGMNKNNS